MGIHVEHCGTSDRPPLVLVHGWGFGAVVWQPLVAELSASFSLYLINLPGYGAAGDACGGDWSLTALLAEFGHAIPRPALWCGWSLGGMLAIAFAAAAQERVTGVVTIGAAPVFVATEDWPDAMPEPVFNSFAALTQYDQQQALNRFAGLVTQSAISARRDLRDLKQLQSTQAPPGREPLLAGLELLRQLDLRETWSGLFQPTLQLFGEADALVPAAAAIPLSRLNPRGRVELITGASHIPWLSNPQGVAERIQRFAAEAGL